MARNEYYHKFLGLRRKESTTLAPSVSFALLENFIPNRFYGGLTARPGSSKWSTTGKVMGIVGYSESNASYQVPNITHPIRHRITGGTSFIERLDWATDTWTAITQGANCAFAGNGILAAAQFSGVLGLCGGKPAKLTDPTAGTLSRLGGSAPAAAPGWVLSAGALTGMTMGYYTYYDSTSGWESSPSPVTSLTTLSSQRITWSLSTTADREGVTHKRLYRTQLSANGEGAFFRVAEVTLATASYIDTIADTSLGAVSEIDFFDHDPPPTTSYLIIAYQKRFWIAVDNQLWFSKAHDGEDVNLEYFSPDRVIYFPHRITGLAYTPDFGRLLVFQPAEMGIHYVSGRSEETFETDIFKGSEGTSFISSVASHGDMVAYWGSNGPAMITPTGEVSPIGLHIENDLREALTAEYNGDVFIFTIFHPMYGFLFFLSAETSDLALWENVDLGTVAEWADSSTGETIDWEP